VLCAGDRVAVVAPSSSFDPAELEAGLAVLRGFGLAPVLATNLRRRESYLAGKDDERLADLDAAMHDDTTAIFCARGGYGAARLLETIAAGRGPSSFDPAATPKLFVGFSDATALHAAWSQRGVASLHAAVVTSLARVGERSRVLTRRILFDAAPLGDVPFDAPTALRGGKASGRLAGGNLAVLSRLVGTAFMPDLRGTLLFLEDVAERPYRLDRMLTHLRMSGALGGVAGILLGDFVRCEEPDAPAGYARALDVLRERLADLGVPVLAGFPSGHGDECFPLPMGLRATIDADAGRLVYEEGFAPR
jgi:muramoyltetrapeptide carboxypeptidase